MSRSRHALFTLLSLITLATATFAALPNPRSGWAAHAPVFLHDATFSATIIDDRTLFVENFSYDGAGLSVYFYLGATNSQAAFDQGLQLGPQLVGTVYDNDSLMLTLPPGESIDSYTALSVWCVTAGVSFTDASFLPPTPASPRAGWVANLSTIFHDVAGTVTLITDRLAYAQEFTYDGNAPAVYFYFGATDSQPDFLAGLESHPLLTRAYANETEVIAASASESFDNLAAVSVWCAAVNVNFGSGTFHADPPGDHNNSGAVDAEDLDNLATCFQGPDEPYPTIPGSTRARTLGAYDLDADADVDLNDLVILQTNARTSNSSPVD